MQEGHKATISISLSWSDALSEVSQQYILNRKPFDKFEGNDGYYELRLWVFVALHVRMLPRLIPCTRKVNSLKDTARKPPNPRISYLHECTSDVLLLDGYGQLRYVLCDCLGFTT